MTERVPLSNVNENERQREVFENFTYLHKVVARQNNLLGSQQRSEAASQCQYCPCMSELEARLQIPNRLRWIERDLNVLVH